MLGAARTAAAGLRGKGIMKQAIVHIGMHKTASTSIQATFWTHRDLLDKRGLHYARFHVGRQAMPNHSQPLQHLFARDAGQPFNVNLLLGQSRAALTPQFQRAFEASLATDKTLILSGEALSQFGPAQMQALKDALARHGFSPRFIMYVRAPYEFMVSNAGQRIKQDLASIDPDRLRQAPVSKGVAAVRAMLPDCAFIPFAQARDHPGGPVAHLAELIQPGLSAVLTPVRQNEAVSDAALRLLLSLNRQIPLFVEDPVRRVNPLRAGADTRSLLRLPGRRFGLRPDELDPVRAFLERDNRDLAELLGPEFCDRAIAPIEAGPSWLAEAARPLDQALLGLSAPLVAAVIAHLDAEPDLPEEIRAVVARHRRPGAPSVRRGLRRIRRRTAALIRRLAR